MGSTHSTTIVAAITNHSYHEVLLLQCLHDGHFVVRLHTGVNSNTVKDLEELSGMLELAKCRFGEHKLGLSDLIIVASLQNLLMRQGGLIRQAGPGEVALCEVTEDDILILSNHAALTTNCRSCESIVSS